MKFVSEKYGGREVELTVNLSGEPTAELWRRMSDGSLSLLCRASSLEELIVFLRGYHAGMIHFESGQ